ncbi:hypothetical protein ELI02_27455 (plasmid) [Rhizobium leguminosarum]|uniref:Uncharacterized protein n=1 Tax=Rhizobium leguminosarum TaxID=384 RepID=A0A4V2II99_RHILE|nr:hypothetical protein ELI41_34685 [Rhizobium leguminosarum]TAV41290.1 hypothetical protein ELI29_34550 [Rhizobium leguminosarum]TAV41761.1 hypothetical protein ELI31_31165 [Rhizobium leguminosarum]TAV42228.1 hypothetical protein ELI32_32480 [Rhizobium leguminosarum]TAV61478.1 hypothetical protein ELI30_32290 [Rhizobium leguminosarum]
MGRWARRPSCKGCSPLRHVRLYSAWQADRTSARGNRPDPGGGVGTVKLFCTFSGRQKEL